MPKKAFKALPVAMAIATALLPSFAASAGVLGGGSASITSLLREAQDIVNRLIPIVFALGLLTFFWGMVKYIYAIGGDNAKVEGRKIMIGGVIALFVMSAVWGIIETVRRTLGVGPEKTIDIPYI